jgi:hypothetical protein
MTELSNSIMIGIGIGFPLLGLAVQWGIMKNNNLRHQKNIDSLWEKKADIKTVNEQFNTVNAKLDGIDQKLDLYINMNMRKK